MLFYATGIVPFFLFTGVSGSVASAVVSNRGLLHYPVVSPLDAVFGKFILDFLTMLWLASCSRVDHLRLCPAGDARSSDGAHRLHAGGAARARGRHGNCVLFGHVPDLAQHLERDDQPLFIISGTFFIYESPPRLPENHVVEPLGARGGAGARWLLRVYDPYHVSIAYVLAIAGGLFVIGAYLLRRHASWPSRTSPSADLEAIKRKPASAMRRTRSRRVVCASPVGTWSATALSVRSWASKKSRCGSAPSSPGRAAVCAS